MTHIKMLSNIRHDIPVSGSHILSHSTKSDSRESTKPYLFQKFQSIKMSPCHSTVQDKSFDRRQLGERLSSLSSENGHRSNFRNVVFFAEDGQV